MAEFPILKTGAIAQYGIVAGTRGATAVFPFLDGTSQRYCLRKPQRLWVVRLDQLDEGELAAVDAFAARYFDTLEAFSFSDPWSGATYANCRIEGNSSRIRAEAGARGSTSLTIVQEVS